MEDELSELLEKYSKPRYNASLVQEHVDALASTLQPRYPAPDAPKPQPAEQPIKP